MGEGEAERLRFSAIPSASPPGGGCAERASVIYFSRIMGKSAIEKLSRACAILPASCLAEAAALLALAPLAARAEDNGTVDAVLEKGG